MKGGGFGALKSDSTHHFFTNACTKSGSLRFSQFSGCWLILSVYILEFWLSLCKTVRSSVILLLPLFTENEKNSLSWVTLKRHLSIRVSVAYIDTGSPVPHIQNHVVWQTKIKHFLRNGNDSKQPYWNNWKHI
jgi:hypothetical protein